MRFFCAGFGCAAEEVDLLHARLERLIGELRDFIPREHARHGEGQACANELRHVFVSPVRIFTATPSSRSAASAFAALAFGGCGEARGSVSSLTAACA